MNVNLQTIISASLINKRIRELGSQITEEFRSKEILVVSPLKGAFLFCADLIRSLDLTLRIDFIELSSYGNGTSSSGNIRMLKDLSHDAEGRHVILVEDILDSGLTMAYAIDMISGRNPASLSVAVLLDKKKTDIIPDYTGFEIEDVFVVGYGMDYRGYFRNLDHIAVMDEKNRKVIDDNIEKSVSQKHRWK